MAGEHNLLLVTSLVNLHLDLFLLLTHFRYEFVDGAYNFRLLMLDRISMDGYRRTTWRARQSTRLMMQALILIIGPITMLRGRGRSTHVDFLVSI